MNKFNVLLELKTGGFQLLSYRNKTAWSKRTALKHAKDCKERLTDNIMYKHYRSVAISEADYASEIIYI